MVLDCQGGTDPCPGQLCRESDDTCVECLNNGQCDDGTFCNGAETCDGNGNCQSGANPCLPAEWCNEATTGCVPFGNGDFDADGDVDLKDFHAFQQCFGLLATGGCEPGNMNGGGTIDLADFAEFANLLSVGGP